MSILNFAPEVQFSGEYLDYSDEQSAPVDSAKAFRKIFFTNEFSLWLKYGYIGK